MGYGAAPVPKKLLQLAGIEDCYTSTCGRTRTAGNFVKATFQAIKNTYAYLTPEFWTHEKLQESPYQAYTDHLAKSSSRRY